MTSRIDQNPPELEQEIEREIAALTGQRAALVDFQLGRPEQIAAISAAIEVPSGEASPDDCEPAVLTLIPNYLLTTLIKARARP